MRKVVAECKSGLLLGLTISVLNNSVIFVNENENKNDEKWENNEFVNENWN